MIYRQCRLKSTGAVAVLADVGSLYVRRALTRRPYAIVAAHTVVDDTRMIEDCGHPRRCRVTIVALVARRNMIRCLACCLKAIVTTLATACDGRMIHVTDNRPVGCDVAIRALAVCRNVT